MWDVVAQGEMALEEFLKQVRETWQYYELDLVAYQNKCKLIRGWDELFNKLKENINQVPSPPPASPPAEPEPEREEYTCKVCMVGPLNAVWECGHFLCVECAERIKNHPQRAMRKCQQCRSKKVQKYIRCYLP